MERVDPSHPAARHALIRYLEEVGSLIGVAVVGPHEVDDVDSYRAPSGAFLVMREGEEVIGCGAVRTIDEGFGEIKRMWIEPSHRGRGLGSRLLDEVEATSRHLGHRVVRLDTNEVLHIAMRLYETRGYVRVPRYNVNPDATHFYEKRLSD